MSRQTNLPRLTTSLSLVAALVGPPLFRRCTQLAVRQESGTGDPGRTAYFVLRVGRSHRLGRHAPRTLAFGIDRCPSAELVDSDIRDCALGSGYGFDAADLAASIRHVRQEWP